MLDQDQNGKLSKEEFRNGLSMALDTYGDNTYTYDVDKYNFNGQDMIDFN